MINALLEKSVSVENITKILVIAVKAMYRVVNKRDSCKSFNIELTFLKMEKLTFDFIYSNLMLEST